MYIKNLDVNKGLVLSDLFFSFFFWHPRCGSPTKNDLFIMLARELCLSSSFGVKGESAWKSTKGESRAAAVDRKMKVAALLLVGGKQCKNDYCDLWSKPLLVYIKKGTDSSVTAILISLAPLWTSLVSSNRFWVSCKSSKYRKSLTYDWLLSDYLKLQQNFPGLLMTRIQRSDGRLPTWSHDHLLVAWQLACIIGHLQPPYITWLWFAMFFLPKTGIYFRFPARKKPFADNCGFA